MQRNINPLLTTLRRNVPQLLPPHQRVYTTQYRGGNRHRVKFYNCSRLAGNNSKIGDMLTSLGWTNIIVTYKERPFRGREVSFVIYATKQV